MSGGQEKDAGAVIKQGAGQLDKGSGGVIESQDKRRKRLAKEKAKKQYLDQKDEDQQTGG